MQSNLLEKEGEAIEGVPGGHNPQNRETAAKARNGRDRLASAGSRGTAIEGPGQEVPAPSRIPERRRNYRWVFY